MAAKSLFGEDALANCSLEKMENGQIQGEYQVSLVSIGRGTDFYIGHLRIRSRTQGIALSLGDKITLSQKAFKP